MRKTTIWAALIIAVALLGLAVWSMAEGDRSEGCPVQGAGCAMDKADCPKASDSCPKDATSCAEGKDCCADGKNCCPKTACPKDDATCAKKKEACGVKAAGCAAVGAAPAATSVTSVAKSDAKSKTDTVICPVMGGKVTDISKAKKSVYKGKTYYFCCPSCKPAFDKDPAKYVKPTSG